MSLLGSGIVVMLLGGVFALCSIDDWKTRRRFRSTPIQSIADAPGEGVVRIHGKVCPSDEGLVRVPLAERDAVWYCLTVSEQVQSGKSKTWKEILRRSDDRAFLVDDGSGQCAIVQPHGGKFLVEREEIAWIGLGSDPSDEFELFLAENGIKSTGILGFRKTLRCELQCISPDDTVHVLGPSRRPGQGFNSFYRMSTSSQLVLSINEQTKDPLYFSTQTHAELTGIAWFFLISVMVFCFGLLLVIIEFTV